MWRRWGKPQKQIIIKETAEVGRKKKKNNFNIYNAAFKKNNKIKKNSLKISLWKSPSYGLQFLRYRAKYTEIGHFRSFFALLPSKDPKTKNQDFKKSKNLLEISSFYTSTKNHNHMYGSWDMECNTKFFVIMDRLLPFYPPMDQENQNFEKMKETL